MFCWVIGVFVDAEDEGEVRVFAGGGDDDFFCAGGEVLAGAVPGAEDAGGFDDDVDVHLFPGEFRGVDFRGEGDEVAVDFDAAGLGHDIAVEPAVDGVVFEKVGEDLGVAEVVDGYDFKIFAVLGVLYCGAQYVSSYASEAVNCYSNHRSMPPVRLNFGLLYKLSEK